MKGLKNERTHWAKEIKDLLNGVINFFFKYWTKQMKGFMSFKNERTNWAKRMKGLLRY